MSYELHTPQSVLLALKTGPAQFKDLCHVGQKPRYAKGLWDSLNELKASKLVKKVYIDQMMHWALADWNPTDQEILKSFEGRSVRTIDGCLRWRGAVTPQVGPVAYAGKDYVESVWRVTWRIKRVAPGLQDMVRPTCGEPMCIEFKHLAKTRRGESQAGRAKSPVHRQRVMDAIRAKFGKITMEDARDIRASKEANKVLMERYDISKSTLWSIKAGKRWKEPIVGGMFTGLLADERKAA